VPSAGGIPLTDEQRLAWLRLIRSENVGPSGIRAQMHQGRNPARFYRLAN
jgi:gluconate kinase